MPVIPTYRAGVGAADLSGAYLGARRIAQEAYSDAARIQLGREQLAQQAVANEMELAVKREALARQAMKQQQEAEIVKAYRETQIGLRQRELANDEAITAMRLEDAAREFEEQQRYSRRFKELEPTLGAEGAARQASLERGGTGLSAALNQPQGPSAISGLNFQLSQLNAMERSIMDKYPGITARRISGEDKTKLDDIQKRRAELQIPQSVQQPPVTSTSQSRQGYMFPPMPGNVPAGTQIPPMIGGEAPAGSTFIGASTGANVAPTLRVVRDKNGKLVIQR